MLGSDEGLTWHASEMRMEGSKRGLRGTAVLVQPVLVCPCPILYGAVLSVLAEARVLGGTRRPNVVLIVQVHLSISPALFVQD